MWHGSRAGSCLWYNLVLASHVVRNTGGLRGSGKSPEAGSCLHKFQSVRWDMGAGVLHEAGVTLGFITSSMTSLWAMWRHCVWLARYAVIMLVGMGRREGLGWLVCTPIVQVIWQDHEGGVVMGCWTGTDCDIDVNSLIPGKIGCYFQSSFTDWYHQIFSW